MTNPFQTSAVSYPESQNQSLPGNRGGFFSSNPELCLDGFVAAPVHLRAVVILELCDHQRSRWVLLDEDPAAYVSGRWRFPGTVFAPGEMPLQAAIRAITEQLALRDGGLPVSWEGLENRVLTVGIDLQPELRVSGPGACRLAWENTLVFSYHARMQVADVARVELNDVTPASRPRAWLAGILDLELCVGDGTLCAGTEQLWKSYWDRRAA